MGPVLKGAEAGTLKTRDGQSILMSLKEFSELIQDYLPGDTEFDITELLSLENGEILPFDAEAGVFLPIDQLAQLVNRFVQLDSTELQGQLSPELIESIEFLQQRSSNHQGLSELARLLKGKLEQVAELSPLDAKPVARDASIETLTDSIKQMIKDALISEEAGDAWFDKIQGQQGQAAKQALLTLASTSSSSVDTPILQAATQAATVTETAKSGTNLSQTVQVDTQLGKSGWAESFNSRVVLMAKDQIQSAQIKIKPAELGPVEIRLSVNQDQTNIHFIAQHGDVREVIEEAFPRLREMMQQSGINLGDVNVSDGQDSEQLAEFEQRQSEDNLTEEVNAEPDTDKPQDRVSHTVSSGLIDQYI